MRSATPMLLYKQTSPLAVSFSQTITIRELIDAMLGRFYLAKDRDNYTMENLPLAVLTVMVDGRNVGSDDPKETEVAIAVVDGLEDEEKVMLMKNKRRDQVDQNDWQTAKKFNLQKLTRLVNAFESLLRGSGKGKPC